MLAAVAVAYLEPGLLEPVAVASAVTVGKTGPAVLLQQMELKILAVVAAVLALAPALLQAAPAL
jgi:hypothetical protein